MVIYFLITEVIKLKNKIKFECNKNCNCKNPILKDQSERCLNCFGWHCFNCGNRVDSYFKIITIKTYQKALKEEENYYYHVQYGIMDSATCDICKAKENVKATGLYNSLLYLCDSCFNKLPQINKYSFWDNLKSSLLTQFSEDVSEVLTADLSNIEFTIGTCFFCDSYDFDKYKVNDKQIQICNSCFNKLINLKSKGDFNKK